MQEEACVLHTSVPFSGYYVHFISSSILQDLASKCTLAEEKHYPRQNACSSPHQDTFIVCFQPLPFCPRSWRTWRIHCWRRIIYTHCNRTSAIWIWKSMYCKRRWTVWSLGRNSRHKSCWWLCFIHQALQISQSRLVHLVQLTWWLWHRIQDLFSLCIYGGAQELLGQSSRRSL